MESAGEQIRQVVQSQLCVTHRVLWDRMQWAIECNDVCSVARLAHELRQIEREIGPVANRPVAFPGGPRND